MNTILCLALILLGLRSMVIHRKMKRKIKQRILEKVIRNRPRKPLSLQLRG